MHPRSVLFINLCGARRPVHPSFGAFSHELRRSAHHSFNLPTYVGHMVDTLTPEQRRKSMSSVRSKNTSPELVLRRALFALGYRYRLHAKSLPGKPDIVFPGRRKVIFINGCFWHSHNCPRGALAPVTNAEFWAKKRQATADRDARNILDLESAGWAVLTVWQCELRDIARAREVAIHFLDD